MNESSELSKGGVSQLVAELVRQEEGDLDRASRDDCLGLLLPRIRNFLFQAVHIPSGS